MQKSSKSNFAYTLTYNFLNILIPLISTPYLARILGAERIGVYSYYYSIAYYFVICTLLGLNNYGNRSIAGVRDNHVILSKTFWDIYYMQCALSIIATALYLLYVFLLAENKLISGLLGLYVISAGLDITWFYFGVEDFKFTVIRNLIIKIGALILILFIVKGKDDLWKYTLIMSLSFLLSQLLLWTKIKRYVKKEKFDFYSSLVHLKPNLFLFVPVVAISIYNMMDKIMLGTFCSKEQVGFYENAEKIINIPQVFVTALGTAMLPRISNMLAKGEENDTVAYLKKSLVFSSAISSACTFGIISIAPEFVPLFLGDGYGYCITLLYYLMPMLLFKAFANVARTQYLIPREKDKAFIISVCCGATINFILNLILIPQMEAVGACIATIFAEITVCVWQMSSIFQEQKITKAVLSALLFQVSGLIMFFVLRAIPYKGNLFWIVFIKICIGIVIYSVLSVPVLLVIKKKQVLSEN